jgi:hypothetical protein
MGAGVRRDEGIPLGGREACFHVEVSARGMILILLSNRCISATFCVSSVSISYASIVATILRKDIVI